MRRSPFTEEQMVTVLREADKTSVAEAAKKHKANEPSVYAWRKHFGQIEAADVKRLKALEIESSRLKKLLAERDLDIEVLKEINAKKSGEPAGPTRTGRPRLRAGPVTAQSLWAHWAGSIRSALRAAPAGQGRSGHRGHENAVSAVPALRLPSYPDPPAPAGLGVELLAHPPHLAPGGPAAAQETPSQAYCQ